MEHPISESVTQSALKVDEQAGIIYNIKVLGEDSRNGFSYPQETRQALHPVIEGMRCNIDHNKKLNPGKDVPVEKRFGLWHSPREENNATYANLHYSPKHPLADFIVDVAKRMPEMLGASIFGKGYDKGRKSASGKLIIESVSFLDSIDLVTDPGTVRSLKESADMPEEVKEPTAEEHYWEACKQAILSILEEETTVEERVKKIKEHLKNHEKMYSKEEEVPEHEMKEAEPVEESVDAEKMKEYLQLKAEKECRELCESLSFEPDKNILNVLSQLKDEDARKDHILYIKRKSQVKAPKSAGTLEITRNLSESKDEKKTDLKTWAERLRKPVK